MRKKITPAELEKDIPDKKDIIFCTECGQELEVFGIADNSVNIEAVKKNFENCRKTGKFKGEICSKLFIISETEDEFMIDED
ncbi:MAG: hypothetical protein JW995_00050 [Melioribacteraceae bacterium]|nr:hypothetical protein [Melioribacteraceae bacterium]